MSLALLYALIFIALVIGGEVFLIPLIYFGLIGSINLWHIIILAVAATLFADSAWYFVGRLVKEERLRRLPILRKRVALLDRMHNTFVEKGGMAVLWFSKFVYGTRIIVQLLCGIYRMPYLRYAAVNTFGILAWIVVLVVIASLVDTGLAGVKETAYGLQIVFAVFAVLAIGVGTLIRRYVRRRWFQGGGERPSHDSS